MKKSLTILIVALMVITSVFAQGSSESSKSAEVYFLNFKPEIADIYTNEIAPAFEAETGIKLKVVTAASTQYETTLRSEMAKSNPPVIFQTNGPVGLANSADDVAALENTEFYSLLADKSMALTLDGHVVAIPYAVEGYGIIYNDAIMRKYISLPGAKISSVDEIKSFDTLKAVVEDMQAKKDQLGIKGVFASTSMAAGNDWRWQTHLFNLPLYQEMAEKNPSVTPLENALAATTLDFTYNKEFQQIWDLYLNNSTTAKGLVGSKTVDDSMAEFALGQAAMVQNGNWGAAQILGVTGNTVADSDIKFLPIYIGLPGEETQGLCVGTENYLCINKNASAEAQANADKFLTWLFSSETGKKYVSEKLNFITPFNSFAADELPADPLSKEVSIWMTKDGVHSVTWTFAGIPSEQWKSDFGSALLDYINGSKNWAAVTKVAQDSWATEARIAGR